MFDVKKLVKTAVFIALGILFPFIFHSVPNGGSIFLPMHIPVLMCGFVCGWPYGLVCGIITPILSSTFTGMPPITVLPGMTFELAVYGAVSGFLYSRLKGVKAVNIYLSLIIAMLCGRITYGALNSLIFMKGSYSMQIWIAAAFVRALPGIAIQLALVPGLVYALERAGLGQIKDS